MLILSRKVNETIRIGNNVELIVCAIQDGKIRIGITAPKDMPIYRGEVWDTIQAAGGVDKMGRRLAPP